MTGSLVMPTNTRRPAVETHLRLSAIAVALPVASNTTSANRPPGSEEISIPNRPTKSWRDSFRSTTCTLAPCARANCITASPIGPAPMTSAFSPFAKPLLSRYDLRPHKQREHDEGCQQLQSTQLGSIGEPVSRD